MDNNTLLLIDGSSFAYRAYHAIPNLTSPDGRPTGAIYGVVNMLKQLQKRFSTSHIGCVFDAPGSTFRDEIHTEYKATRESTPEGLISQLNDMYSIINALGIPLIIERGVEADDIIGTLAIKAKNLGYKVIIATGDKDFSQLVDPNDQITLINTMSNEALNYQGVINKFGVKPEQFIDYLALVGDKVDNVKGVDKCGPKTGAKWLSTYQTLDNLIIHANEIGGVVGDNLRIALPWLPTGKSLVTIHVNLNLSHILPNGINDLVCTPPDIKALKAHYLDLGFKTWLNQLNTDTPEIKSNNVDTNLPSLDLFSQPGLNPIKNNLVIIENTNELEQIIKQLANLKEKIGILLIPNDFANVQYLKYVFISAGKTTYIIKENHVSNDLFSEASQVVKYAKPLELLFLNDIPKVSCNYKECLEILSRLKLRLNNVIGDINLAHYLKNSKSNQALSSVYEEFLKLEIVDIPSVTHKQFPKNSAWNNLDEAGIIENGVKIVNNIVALEDQIKQQLNAKELHLYQDVELPLCKILVEIEANGIKLDVNKFAILDAMLNEQINVLENTIYKKVGHVFNIGSPKQLSDVLFNQLSLPTQGMKKNTNGFSTDEDALNLLASHGFDVASDLLEYRGLSKLLNTYVGRLPKMVDLDHRVHTTFEQAYVASGRLSSRDPNLQNIPASSTWGNKIRECFIAKQSHMLICADYSQIELRILAHISQDENLINAFNQKLDVHTATASEIFHKDISEVTKDERRYAKTINFSLLYGKTVFGLSQELKIDRTTAKLYIDTYFAKYPKVKGCLDKIKEFSHNNGYVETIYGRRIYLTNINSHNRILRDAEERLALNAPMQGSSADIIKIAMCHIDKWLKENNLNSKIVLQIHDELILEVPEQEINLIMDNLPNLMTSGFNLLVDLAVDVSISSNWAE